MRMVQLFGFSRHAGVIVSLVLAVSPALAGPSCQLGFTPYEMTIPDGTSVTLFSAPSVPKGESCDSVAVSAPCKAGVLIGEETARYAGCLPLDGFTGVNVNGEPEMIDPRLLQDSGAPWVRAFINVVKAKADFAAGKSTAGLDAEDWKAFLAAATSGSAKTILSLKWGFSGSNTHPPLPGSAEEKALFDFLDRRILNVLAPSITIIVSGNEPFVDTLDVDWQPNAAYGGIPVVVFYQRATAHVNDYLVEHRMRDTKKLFVGAFTRLYAAKMQTSPAVAQLLNFAEQTAFVDGVDVHTHVARINQIGSSLDFAELHTSKPLIVTEYTYVHAMDAALSAGKPVGATFGERWHVAATMTELDYLRCNVFHRGPGCKSLPTISKAEWDDFITSRPWFVDHFLLQADRIFKAHGVMGATFGLVSDAPGAENLKPDGTPWYLGFLYSPGALGTDEKGLALPNTQYLDDFRQLNGHTE